MSGNITRKKRGRDENDKHKKEMILLETLESALKDKQRELAEGAAMEAAEKNVDNDPLADLSLAQINKSIKKINKSIKNLKAKKQIRTHKNNEPKSPPHNSEPLSQLSQDSFNNYVGSPDGNSQGSSNYVGSPYDAGSQGSNLQHPVGLYKHTAQDPGSSLNSNLKKAFNLEEDETPSGQQARKGSSLKKGEEAQFNASWSGIINNAKKSRCYICGCPIVKKMVLGGKKIGGHSPEMEHVIVPGEFFMKFGTEFLANPKKIINTPGTFDEYKGIHEYGSDGSVPLRKRINDVKTELDLRVNSSRVKSGLGLSFPAKYGYPTEFDITVTYDEDFFVPQIKSYMVQFAYAHHICNQIKGHMPVLEGSDGLNFSDNGEYIPNSFTGTIERYADILVDVVMNINNKPKAKIGKGQTDPYYQGFNDGCVCYIAAPKSDEYREEIPDIYTCWFGNGKGKPSDSQIRNIKTRIIKNMLYHSALLRMTRRECTLQRLKHPYYIRKFTTLIPDYINDESKDESKHKRQLREEAINEIVTDVTKIVDDDLKSVKGDDDDDNCSVSVFSEDEEIKNVRNYKDFFTQKKLLYKKIGVQPGTTQTAMDVKGLNSFLETNNMGRVADLIASNVIYKAHQMMNIPSKQKDIGGKRTKRRRGRGKSKKKVTRKKRVKRRKTVKKIKRKRRRTRKC